MMATLLSHTHLSKILKISKPHQPVQAQVVQHTGPQPAAASVRSSAETQPVTQAHSAQPADPQSSSVPPAAQPQNPKKRALLELEPAAPCLPNKKTRLLQQQETADWSAGMTREEEIAADERAYLRSLRDRDRIAQRERAETEQFKAEKVRLAANDRVFGKKYRTPEEIAEDNEMERFLEAKFRVIDDSVPAPAAAGSRRRASDSEAAPGYEHIPEECNICNADWDLKQLIEELPAAKIAATAAPDVLSTSPDKTTSRKRPAPDASSSSATMAFWCPPFREVEGRRPQHRPAARAFAALYKRGLLGYPEGEEPALPPVPSTDVRAQDTSYSSSNSSNSSSSVKAELSAQPAKKARTEAVPPPADKAAVEAEERAKRLAARAALAASAVRPPQPSHRAASSSDPSIPKRSHKKRPPPDPSATAAATVNGQRKQATAARSRPVKASPAVSASAVPQADERPLRSRTQQQGEIHDIASSAQPQQQPTQAVQKPKSKSKSKKSAKRPAQNGHAHVPQPQQMNGTATHAAPTERDGLSQVDFSFSVPGSSTNGTASGASSAPQIASTTKRKHRTASSKPAKTKTKPAPQSLTAAGIVNSSSSSSSSSDLTSRGSAKATAATAEALQKREMRPRKPGVRPAWLAEEASDFAHTSGADAAPAAKPSKKRQQKHVPHQKKSVKSSSHSNSRSSTAVAHTVKPSVRRHSSKPTAAAAHTAKVPATHVFLHSAQGEDANVYSKVYYHEVRPGRRAGTRTSQAVSG